MIKPSRPAPSPLPLGGWQVKPVVGRPRSDYATRWRDNRYNEVTDEWVAEAVGVSSAMNPAAMQTTALLLR